MKNIHRYNFFRKKYGAHLLADVVTISEFRKYIHKNPIHRLTYFDLTFITEGSEYMTINQSRLLVEHGDVICSTPGDVWTWERDTALEGYALVFEEEFFRSFFINKFFLNDLNYLKAERLSALIKIKSELFSEILEILEKIRLEINGADRSEHVIRALVYLILAKLDTAEKAHFNSSFDMIAEKQSNRHLQGFIKLVEAHYLNSHDVQFYADRLFISANYLNKIVRELLGTTSKKYIAHKIAQEAKNLLSFTDLSISEISDQLKFESPSYFTRFFKKSVGVKPKEYRIGNKPFNNI